MQEERLREEILQQRRQQVQDVTERFQRAHLPPSQKYRQCKRNVATTLTHEEEAHLSIFCFFFLQLSEETPQTLKMHLVKFKAVPTPSNPPFCQAAQTSTGKRVQIQKNLIIHFKIFDSGLVFFFCFGSKSNTSLGPFFLTLQFFSHVIYL